MDYILEHCYDLSNQPTGQLPGNLIFDQNTWNTRINSTIRKDQSCTSLDRRQPKVLSSFTGNKLKSPVLFGLQNIEI